MSIKSWNQISKGKTARQKKRDDDKARQEAWEEENRKQREIAARSPPKWNARTLAIAAVVLSAGMRTRLR